MAIDYSGFGQARGGLAGQSIGQGLSQLANSLPTPEERTQTVFSKYFNTLDMSMNPVFEVSEGGSMSYKGVPNQSGDFSISDFKVKTMSEAWNDYTGKLNNKGVKLRPDEYTRFAEMYTAKSNEWGMNLASKFERMKNSGLSKSQIRDVVSKNPDLLQNLSKISAISPESYASFQDYLVPGKGLIPGLMSNLGNLAGASLPMGIPAGYAGYKAYSAAKTGKGLDAARKAAGRRMIPFSAASDKLLRAGLGKGKGTAEAIRKIETQIKGADLKSGKYKRMGTKSIIKGQKAAVKAVDASKKSLQGAQDTVDKLKKTKRKEWTTAEKAWKLKQKNPKAKYKVTGGGSKKVNEFKYKGKTYKTAGGLKREVKVAENSLNKATKAVETAKANLKGSYKPSSTKKQQLKTIQSYIKRHGRSGLMKKLYKKLGWKGAAKLISAAGLSLAGKGGTAFTGGVSTAASFALDAWTIASIAQVLNDVRKESGGIRRPDKMLFGGGDTSGARGASY